MGKENIFHPDTIKEAEDLKKQKAKEAKKRIEIAIELGKKCLANPDFAKYKENYEALEKIYVDAWIDMLEPDPLKYTVQARGMALQLNQLRLLIYAVKEDAAKRVENDDTESE